MADVNLTFTKTEPDGAYVLDRNKGNITVTVSGNSVSGDKETIALLNSMKGQNESLADFIKRSAK